MNPIMDLNLTIPPSGEYIYPYLPRPNPGAPCGLNPGGGANPAGGAPPNPGGGTDPGKTGGPIS